MATTDVLSIGEAKDALKIDDNDHDTRLAAAVTAISQRLDELCGPIVKRTLTAEEHHDVCAQHLWVRWRPVYSTPAVTIVEYDTSGTATTLTAEDHDTKPSDGYRLEQREGLGGGYSGRIHRRSSGVPSLFAETVLVTYDAGRYASTADVDPVFKEVAAVCLINWWQQVLAQVPQAGVDLDLPGYRFPRFAVPDAALDLLPSTEKRTRVGIA